MKAEEELALATGKIVGFGGKRHHGRAHHGPVQAHR